MADVPKDLVEQIKRLEELFVVPTEKLKEISDHFVKELEKGLCWQTRCMMPANRTKVYLSKVARS